MAKRKSRGLRGRQGSVESRKDCGVTQHIVHGHEATAEPDRSDAFRHLLADPRSFFLVADEFIGTAENRAQSAPRSSGGIAPVDWVAGRVASKGAPCPVCR